MAGYPVVGVRYEAAPHGGPSLSCPLKSTENIQMLTVKHALDKSVTARFGPLPVVISNQPKKYSIVIRS